MNLLLKIIRKTLKVIVWSVFILLFLANIFILFSGRFYLYKGVYFTYLMGESSPTIYDKDKFYSSEIKHGNGDNWTLHKSYGKTELSPSDSAFFKELHTTAFLVFKNDELLHESYFEGHEKFTVSNSFSAAKTVVSMLVGIAIEEGKIKDINDPVSKYIPEFKGGGKEKITIYDLLIMASGLNWTESGSNPLSENAESYYGSNLFELVTQQKLISDPGKVFNYQSGNSQLLAYVLERATGQDLTHYAQEKLWRKIGANSNAFWSLDKQNGDEKAFCCLYSTAQDFARLAYLLNHKGRWKNTQVIPENYFKKMITPAKMETEEGIPNLRYGLHVWTYFHQKDTMYYCRGIHGQYMMALPKENLLIVRLGKKRSSDYAEKTGSSAQQIPSEKWGLVGHPADVPKYISLAKKLAAQVN